MPLAKLPNLEWTSAGRHRALFDPANILPQRRLEVDPPAVLAHRSSRMPPLAVMCPVCVGFRSPLHSTRCCGQRGSRYGLLLRRADFGASSLNFSKASGIMRPNMELSIAVGMRPPLFSCPCAPDIKNCGTSG
jgi:hypothetical protein